MKGKVCLVTGATDGIGKVTALALAKMGATVVVVGRNPVKCAAVVSEIRQRSNNPAVEALIADLSVMAEVQRLADQFKAKHRRLDVLVNNAGAMFPERQVTSEGFELTFALNHLSYFLLTNLLLDTLKASAPSCIVNVSSVSHKGVQLDFDDLQSEQNYSGYTTYSRSKLANIVFTYELARRLAGSGVTANALHPGLVRSTFRDNLNLSRLQQTMNGIFTRIAGVSVEQGAKTSIYLASSPEVEGMTGKYWEKQRSVLSSPVSYDDSTWTRLWDMSEKMVLASQENVVSPLLLTP